MEGVARLAPSKSHEPVMNSVLEEYQRGDAYSYDAPIPVMESSGQDVLDLEMNRDVGYLDTREFGKATQFNSIPAQAYQDYSEAGYDMLGESSSSYAMDQSASTGNEQQRDHEVGSSLPTEKRLEQKEEQQSFDQRPSVHHHQSQFGEHPQAKVAEEQQQRFDTSLGHNLQSRCYHGAMQSRQVPIFPVKTADPATCSQYAPMRPTQTNLMSFPRPSGSSSSRRSNSRSQTKKEPLDPIVVEEEVARNVSQILSMTKQHRAQMEANNARAGLAAQQQQQQQVQASSQPKMLYHCPDCNKQVSSTRNLQRHRQSCPASRKFSQPQSQATITTQPLPSLQQSSAPTSQSTIQSMGAQNQQIFIRKPGVGGEEPIYCEWSRPSSVSTVSSLRDTVSQPPSRDESFVSVNSAPLPPPSLPSFSDQHMVSLDSQVEAPTDLAHLDPRSFSLTSSRFLDDPSSCLQPLSLLLDDDGTSGRESGSASRGSETNSNSGNGSQSFKCEACKKSVASFRSLKRHHTTCKLFAQEFPHLLEQERADTEARRKKMEEQRAETRLNLAMESFEGALKGSTMGGGSRVNARKRVRKVHEDQSSRSVSPCSSDPTTSNPLSTSTTHFPPENEIALYHLPPRDSCAAKGPPPRMDTPPTSHPPQHFFPFSASFSGYQPQMDHISGPLENPPLGWSHYDQRILSPQVGGPAQPPRRPETLPAQPPPPQALLSAHVPCAISTGRISTNGSLSTPNYPLSSSSPLPSISSLSTALHHQKRPTTQIADFVSPRPSASSASGVHTEQSPAHSLCRSGEDIKEKPRSPEKPPSPDSSSCNPSSFVNTTCEHCSRQLCSVSNLKRHRATCKALVGHGHRSGSPPATPSSGSASASATPSPAKSIQWTNVEVLVGPKERQILDRSYAAALAASQAEQQQRTARSLTFAARQQIQHQMVPQQQIVIQQGYVDPGGNRPWITVGEHLKAQHVQQKMYQQQPVTQRLEPGVQIMQQGMQLGSGSHLQQPTQQPIPNQNGYLMQPRNQPQGPPLAVSVATSQQAMISSHPIGPSFSMSGSSEYLHSPLRPLPEISLPEPRSAPPSVPLAPISLSSSGPVQRSYSTASYPPQLNQIKLENEDRHQDNMPYINGGPHLMLNGQNGRVEERQEALEGLGEVDDHLGYGYGSTTDVSDQDGEGEQDAFSDLDDDGPIDGFVDANRNNRENGAFGPPTGYGTHEVYYQHPPPTPHPHAAPLHGPIEHRQVSFEQATRHDGGALRAAIDSISPPPRAPAMDRQPTVAASLSQSATNTSSSISSTPLDSIITVQPLPGDRMVYSSRPEPTRERRPSDGNRFAVQAVPQMPIMQHQQQNAQFGNSGMISANPPQHHLPPFSPQEMPVSPPMQNRETMGAVPATPGKEIDLRFQCPECLKTYSCRKNVKRHRMAVHKLTAEEIARNPAPGDLPPGGREQFSPSVMPPHTPAMMNSPLPSRSPHKFSKTTEQWEGAPTGWLPPHVLQQQQQMVGMVDTEERDETARIAAELKRDAEEAAQQTGSGESKKAVAELAEADTTFHEEECEAGGKHEVKSEPVESSSGGDVTAAPCRTGPETRLQTGHIHPQHLYEEDHWRRLLRGTSGGPPGSSAPAVAPPARKPPVPHVCTDCHRTLSSDYSLRRHRQTCPEAKASEVKITVPPPPEVKTSERLSAEPVNVDPMIGHASSIAPQPHQMSHSPNPPSIQCSTSSAESGAVQGEETAAPDSTTQRSGVDSLAHSPSADSTASDNGDSCSGQARKRPPSASGREDPAAKQAKHFCQICGKFYSSEWNLERHRRESCPTKMKRCDQKESGGTEDTIIVGTVKFMVSKQALSRSSTYFSSLFQYHDPGKGDLRVDVDPNEFQMLLDAHNNPSSITASNIDAVAVLADKLKFNTVYDHCEKFISEKLPQVSVMHAIRLAETLKLTPIKQRLFDSISIEVFRSLSADQDYRLMGADLKAELLEKWGTFL